ncbi:MAG TPA: ATP-binding protein [Bacillota bacterium]|nr:ATP-binding protein [Bacillota bacterium]
MSNEIDSNLFPHHLLLNIFFILIPVFLYQLFYLEKPNGQFRKNRELFISVSAALSIILCMSFPFSFNIDFIFDLRAIPFIVASLYGGYRIAIKLFIIEVLFCYILGGFGFYLSLISNSILLILIFICIPKFANAGKGRRLFLAAILSFIYSMIVILVFPFYIQTITQSFYSFTLGYLSINIVVTIISIKLLNLMEQNHSFRKEIMEAEKLKVLSELAASVSHEVRNPLTVTKGFIQLLRERSLSEEKRNNYINLALDELGRAQDILTDYLSFARPDNECFTSLSLIEELNYSLAAIHPYALMHDVIVRTGDLVEGEIVGNRQRFRQCLINILKNSIEAMSSGGELYVTCIPQNQSVMILIHDTGVGMSKEQIQRLGTPYYTTKEKGTGLGMMVVFSIIKAMNGKINIQSQLGKGTRMCIHLPTEQKI